MPCLVDYRSECEWLKRQINCSGSLTNSAEELIFQKSLAAACLRLLQELGIIFIASINIHYLFISDSLLNLIHVLILSIPHLPIFFYLLQVILPCLKG